MSFFSSFSIVLKGFSVAAGCGRPLSEQVLRAMSPAAQLRTIQPDPRWIHVVGVSPKDFGGPVPPSHAHLNLFGGVEQFQLGSTRQHCWTEARRPYPCCDPMLGPEGLESCWTAGHTFVDCCLASDFERLALPVVSVPVEAADFVVVGAGSAGSLVASRLARRGFKVVLLESGGDGLSSLEVHPNPSSPEQFEHWFVHNLQWSLGDVSRTTQVIHGRGLGGSSSVNGRIYTRTPLPFAAALVSAAYEDVESDLSFLVDETSGAWQRDLIPGFKAAGVPFLSNASMSLRASVGPVQRIGGCKGSGRLTAFHCAVGADVQVLKRAHVDRVILEAGRAVGVEIAGSKTRISSRHGVVLSAGALQTPCILVRSGIGHPVDLKRLGIDVAVENREVGANLQDHPYLSFRAHTEYDCDGGALYGFYSSLVKPKPHRVFELQLLPSCSQGLLHLKGHLILLQTTRGRVVVRSRDPAEPPGLLLDPFAATGTAPADAWRLLEGLREVYALLLRRSQALRLEPSAELLARDVDAGQYVARHLGLWQHPMGTAQLGRALDARLRVRGAAQLWVADASALPDKALSGHPDAGVRALGSLAATFAAEEAKRSAVRL